MREVLKGILWTAGWKEVDDLCRPEAFGAYTQYGLRAVLTVTNDSRPRMVAVLPQLCLPIVELEATPHVYFDLACQFVKAFGPTVVHCQAGANRSRVFAAAIAHRLYGVPLEQAIRIADPPGNGPVFKAMLEWAGQS